MVTLGGGEPTLVTPWQAVVKRLKAAGIYVSLHTNGLRLDERTIDGLAPYVGDIALPIDSVRPETQDSLGRKDHKKRFAELTEHIRAAGVLLHLHTVATTRNIDEIPQLYRSLKDRDFGYWRIYEFNDDMIDDRFSCVRRCRQVQELAGPGDDPRNGGIETILAKLLLMEEKMGRKDRRLQFIGKRDKKPPYVFLDNSGDARYCTYFTQKRVFVGNILKEGFEAVHAALTAAANKGVLFDEEGFINSFQDMPLWARLWEGNYFNEEIDELDLRHWPRIRHLDLLYRRRVLKQERELETYLKKIEIAA
jgi:hypothetical protein